MTSHLGDRALDFVLAALPPEEQSVLEAHVAGCAACASEAARAAETFARLADALPAAPPPSGGKARLLAAARHSRFLDFVPRVTRFFDLTAERARDLLAALDEPGSWDETLFPGLRLIHFAGGPAVAGADAGFVWLQAGARFPPHRHRGDERVLVLQGRILLDDGRVVRRGEEIASAEGTAHSFRIGEDLDCIYAVLHHGIDLLPFAG